MKKIIFCSCIFALFISCGKPDSKNINLNGVFNYDWTTPIEEKIKHYGYTNIK